MMTRMKIMKINLWQYKYNYLWSNVKYYDAVKITVVKKKIMMQWNYRRWYNKICWWDKIMMQKIYDMLDHDSLRYQLLISQQDGCS